MTSVQHPGKIYLCGNPRISLFPMPLLPIITFGLGWWPGEAWGLWSAERTAYLSLQTPLKKGEKIALALRLNAPQGSDNPAITVHINATSQPTQKLDTRPRWFFYEGQVGEAGVISIKLSAQGTFGRPDPREIYIGLSALSYSKTKQGFAFRTRAQFFLSRRSILCPDTRASGFQQRSAPHPTPAFNLDSEPPTLPELVAKPVEDLLRHHPEDIEIRKFGIQEHTPWGWISTLRGIESLRGFCISATPIAEIKIFANGFLLYSGSPRGYDITSGLDKTVRKYVFNAWVDLSALPCGRYEMSFHAIDAAGNARIKRCQVMIAPPRDISRYPSSDRIVDIKNADSLEAAINAAPSMIRPAQRSFFPTPVRTILIMRADQLGDLVCSTPALRRLRSIFPQARLVGLLSKANEALARSLNLFDEILLVDFLDDERQRRRVLSLDAQAALQKTLAPYHFDLAIDTSDSGESRPALLLAQARQIMGFRPGEFYWLSSGFQTSTRDPLNASECVPATTKLMGLIAWIDTLSKSHAQIIRREDLSKDLLADFGLKPEDRYIVLHAGARLTFSRWPHYGKLAALILAQTPYKIVMMADEADYWHKLPPQVQDSDRFQLSTRQLSFDQFDALLSFCDGFVGNDSGPKHLASLRGANVVSIHLARNNWNEWGQEIKGYILSRRVPCAGCSLHHDPEECGKDFACITHIQPEEVFDALTRAISSP